MERPLSTRRAVLGRGLGVVSVGIAGALAGCGGGGSDESTEPTETEPAETEQATATEPPTNTETESTPGTSLELVEATGTNITDEGIGRIDLTVTRSSSSGSIDLRDVSIRYSGRTTSDTLWHEATTGSTNSVFSTAPLDDSDEVDRTLDDSDEQHRISIDLTQGSLDEPLGSGGRATVELRIDDGETTTVRLDAPSSFDDQETVSLAS